MKIDSPLVKCSSSRRPTHSTNESSWETFSDESDGDCGYDPDYESDEVLVCGNLKLPEQLRDSVVQQELDSADRSCLTQKRKRSPSIRNLEHVLKDCDRDLVQQLEDATESMEDSSESIQVLASTLIDGKKTEPGPLGFVPDVSSVYNRDSRGTLSFHEIFSAGSSPEVQIKCLENIEEGSGLSGINTSVTPRNKGKSRKNKLSLKKRKSQTNSGVDSTIKQTEAYLEDITEEKNEISDDILVDAPQNYAPTVSRKKSSAEKISKSTKHVTEHSVIEKMEKESKESDGSDDDLIIIDSLDSASINNSKSRKSKRKIEKNIDLASGSNCLRLCEYPVGKSDTVTVAIQDYATLEHDTFLNDIIIDFYLTYLAYNILPIEDRDTVHIFSTMFYKRLMQSPKKNAKKVASYETDSTLKSDEKRHCRVAGWTKNVDLFSKDLLLIPICEHSHWYLLLVVKPGLITSPVRSEERTLKGEPFIIVLDSMGGTKDSAVRNIRQYLACEWKKRRCSAGEDVEQYQFSATQIKTVRPRKPEQENYSDCGIFLLHYVEKVFHSVAQFFWPSLPDLSDWFTIEEIGRKRGEIADLIKCLATEQNPGKAFSYPNIKFTAARKPRKRQKPIVYSSNSSEEDEEEVEARSKGKFASAVYSTRDRESKSKLSRNAKHRSRRKQRDTQKSTESLNSTTDCQVSGVIEGQSKLENCTSRPDTSQVVAETVHGETSRITPQGEETSKGSKRKHELYDFKANNDPDSTRSSVNLKANSSISSNCDNTNVPDSKTKNNTRITSASSKSKNVNNKKQKLEKTRAEQILADLMEFEKHGIEDEEIVETNVSVKNNSMLNSMQANCIRDSAVEVSPNIKILVSRPGESDPDFVPGDSDPDIEVINNSLVNGVGKTLEQMSPNVACNLNKDHTGRLPSDSPLFTSPAQQQLSTREPRTSSDTADTSGQLFTAEGERGGSHIIAHNSEEDVKVEPEVVRNKRFKMVKNSRYEESESQKIFEKFLCSTASEGDSDIFSQEND